MNISETEIVILKSEQLKMEEKVYEVLEEYYVSGDIETMKRKIEKIIQIYEKKVSKILDII